MTSLEALRQHQQLCDDLHELTVEENHFLQQHLRAPDAKLQERKRALLSRLEETLAALREAPRQATPAQEFKQALEKTRSRILQILQLDRENEQLLLRFSLTGHRLGSTAATSPKAAPPSMLQKIYQRHTP
jgi:hypothetical protein